MQAVSKPRVNIQSHAVVGDTADRRFLKRYWVALELREKPSDSPAVSKNRDP